MSAPRRIQLRRTKGWRKPEGAIVVARPGKWGNPFTIEGATEWAGATDDGHARRMCVDSFRAWIGGSDTDWMGPESTERRQWIQDRLRYLAGHDLACWCPLDQPCHADVLLELANRPVQP